MREFLRLCQHRTAGNRCCSCKRCPCRLAPSVGDMAARRSRREGWVTRRRLAAVGTASRKTKQSIVERSHPADSQSCCDSRLRRRPSQPTRPRLREASRLRSPRLQPHEPRRRWARRRSLQHLIAALRRPLQPALAANLHRKQPSTSAGQEPPVKRAGTTGWPSLSPLMQIAYHSRITGNSRSSVPRVPPAGRGPMTCAAPRAIDFEGLSHPKPPQSATGRGPT